MSLSSFDPNQAASAQSNVFGFPDDERAAELIILPVPWDRTASYAKGTAKSAPQVLAASKQVDILDIDFSDSVWQRAMFMPTPSEYIADLNTHAKNIEKASREVNAWVERETARYMQAQKKVLLLGGEHSVSLGYYKALARAHERFDILHIDAHFDLRRAYENYTYSHASIMYNALSEVPAIGRLVSVGVRDFCHEEWDYVQANKERVWAFLDKDMQRKKMAGETWKHIVDHIISGFVSDKIVISFDMDGLDPSLCPHTGTPVPSGLSYAEAMYLLDTLRARKKIVGVDLVEIGYSETGDWDANVGARVLYRLALSLLASA